MDDVGGASGLLYNPPYYERDNGPSGDGFQIHVASHGRPTYPELPENLC